MTSLDCEQVLQLVWQFLDGEMNEAEYREIQAHVAACVDCGPRYEFQRRLMLLIEEKCREGSVPIALRNKLFRLLEE